MLLPVSATKTCPPKVLFVAVDAAVQRAIMAALPTLRSVAAADTYEALDLCLQTRFDLVVAHENAGELSGWDLLSALETTPPFRRSW